MTIARPDYITYTLPTPTHPRVEISAIFCKVCGVQIAGVDERIKEVRPHKDGSRTEVRVRQFTRYPNYTELKMSMEPVGEFHITNGCDKCLVFGLSAEILDEMMEADLREQEDQLDFEYFTQMMARVPTGVVQVRVGGGII